MTTPKGSKLTEQQKLNISRSKIGVQSGSKHPQWKGGISKDKEHLKALVKDWKAKNKDKVYHSNRQWLLLKRCNGVHTFGEWEDLKAKYNWTCPCCRRSEPIIKLTEDHIIPISKGGSNNIENIQPLCKSCNCKKNVSIIKYGE